MRRCSGGGAHDPLACVSPPSLRFPPPSFLPALKGAKLIYVTKKKCPLLVFRLTRSGIARCIGRIAWNTLMVRDKRHVTDLDEIFAECMEHQRLAMADGR